MASVQSLPRTRHFLLPRRPGLVRPQTRFLLLLVLQPPASLRHASTRAGLSAEFQRRLAAAQQHKAAKAVPVIPQPDKYRPPSHSSSSSSSARTVKQRNLEQKIYGPPLSEEDKKRMATKKYPNMMSPEGSFSHWFFHQRALHAWITLGILFSLTIAAWWIEWVSSTIYKHLLPTRKDFWHHPYETTKRVMEVYKMHMIHTTAMCTQERLKKAEDVEKRKQYRLERQREAEERGEEYVVDTRYYVGEDGVRRRRVKRWFGIWE
ncbi:hypothetical protein ACEQ8H_008364 [Pleosporales sp. CAS-2024a]